MGFLDALLGRRKVKGPAPDRLFAITTAYVDLESQQGIKTRGKAAIVFQPLGTSDFQSIVAEMEEVLKGTGDEIGSSVETSVNELATMIRDAAGSRSAVELQPYETYYGASYEDTPRRVPDISRAGELLGWKPEVMLGDGLARTVEWWRTTHG